MSVCLIQFPAKKFSSFAPGFFCRSSFSNGKETDNSKFVSLRQSKKLRDLLRPIFDGKVVAGNCSGVDAIALYGLRFGQ